MKWQRTFVATGLVGLIALILCATARADDSSLGAVGSSVIPLQNDHVTMAAERVDAVIRGNQAWVTCVFTFTNTNSGPPASVLMGFPQMAVEPLRGAPELLGFQTEVDGKAVQTSFKKQQQQSEDEQYAGWYTFNVSFAAGQTRTVRNTYHGRLTFISDGELGFSYVLHTGATWLGSIGRADVTVRWLSDKDVRPGSTSANPPGYQIGNHEAHWHFTNLEPTDQNDVYFFFRSASVQSPGMPSTGTDKSSQLAQALLLVSIAVTLIGAYTRLISHR